MKRKKIKNKHQSFLRRWQQRLSLLKKTNRESGATFMEVLVTIAIIAILMTTIGLAVVPFIGGAQESVAKTNIKTIETALMAYYAQNFEYPEDSDWKSAVQPLIDGGEVPLDPWNNEYVYEKPGPNDLAYGISSAGKDGIMGNDDDIKSWEIK